MTVTPLDLGELKLPALEAQTGTLIVYGGKGMGKTNFGARLVEEFSLTHLRWSWIDPIGVAWGLKHSADGDGPGVEVLVLGGVHGDIPIEPTAGAVVADLVVDEDVSVIVDVSRRGDGRMWTAGEKVRFVRDYSVRLFERQGERRRPLMQVIDEAGRFVPQTIPAKAVDVAECVGAIEQLVELGRNVGVGVTLITQRSARMAKAVSELADMMVAFRTVGPRSIEAIVDWFGEHVPRDEQKALIEQLRELPVGTALVVSPGWLRIEGRFAMGPRRTFDSSSTPIAGQERAPSGAGAAVDLDKYAARMAATIEKAEADDPRALRRRIVELEAWLARQADAPPAAVEVPVEVPVPFLPDDIRVALAGLIDAGEAFDVDPFLAALERMMAEARTKASAFAALARAGVEALDAYNARPAEAKSEKLFARPAPAPPPAPRRDATPPPVVRNVGRTDGLGLPHRRILTVLAQFPGAGLAQVATLAGYHQRSKGFTNALGQLRTAGLVDGLVLTDEGAAHASHLGAERPADLLAHWKANPKIGKAAGLILDTLAAVAPESLGRDDLAARCGYHPRAKGFTNAIGQLRTLGLVHGRGDMRITPELVA